DGVMHEPAADNIVLPRCIGSWQGIDRDFTVWLFSKIVVAPRNLQHRTIAASLPRFVESLNCLATRPVNLFRWGQMDVKPRREDRQIEQVLPELFVSLVFVFIRRQLLPAQECRSRLP